MRLGSPYLSARPNRWGRCPGDPVFGFPIFGSGHDVQRVSIFLAHGGRICAPTTRQRKAAWSAQALSDRPNRNLIRWPMPLWVINGTFRRIHLMPLTPKADIARRRLDVRFEPKSDIANLFDHLVGAGKQRRRYIQAKCFRGPEVDHKLKFRRL